MSLPTLPTKEQYEYFKERKRKETEEAIEAERRAVERKLDLIKVSQDFNSSANGKIVATHTARTLMAPQQVCFLKFYM